MLFSKAYGGSLQLPEVTKCRSTNLKRKIAVIIYMYMFSWNVRQKRLITRTVCGYLPLSFKNIQSYTVDIVNVILLCYLGEQVVRSCDSITQD